jgi:hypothetical protein
MEVSPYFLEDVYEVLIFFYRFFLRVKHHNSGSINLDREQDPVKVVDIYTDKMLGILFLSN